MFYRSDVVGSLLRPSYLVEARQQYEAGQLSAAEFKRIEDRAVDEAIRLQEEAGLEVVTDGEQRRYAFFGHLVEAMEGFDKFGGWAITFRDEQGNENLVRRPIVVDKLRWRRNMCAEEFTYLRARTNRVAKVTLISTMQAAVYWDKNRSVGAYPTVESYLADVVDITRREIEELIRLGCTYIQIDAPQYAALLDPKIREGYRIRGMDPDRIVDQTIELDNAVLDGFDKQGVIFGLHICRGNNQSMFYASGGYDPIAEKVFQKTKFHRFLLEYDDERSGTFEPLRFVPEDRVVVLGLVTTKKMRLESQDELIRRIMEAAEYVPLDRLALSPQCGFASTWEGNRITPEVQRQKLELVARTAKAVWG
ncbi:cobalamin-independent methionine synthase II family protein [Thermomicrobium sp. CFH 73360]|uniref:cobalamin-independent methionine synthase II family protein n=1 Tax=Thermomicrobium sp. CFH 73360 TaxID=2951987 RepID=UPI00207799B6|nr:cobalamin-independent methionine synthase II family protein [Thermomicrobium sp. CFH 73360]